jgi:hypothetical protein
MRATLAILVGAQLTSALAAPSPDEVAKAAFVKGPEVYVTTSSSGEPRQVTSDGLKKGFVALSKDGTLIAFTRETHLDELSCIVVIRHNGAVINVIHFRPAEANIRGMRFVEDLQWITNDRLLVSGSVNPSIGEYATLDVHSGKEVGGYVVDGFSLSPSPDWSHVAYEAAVAHFTDEVYRRPQLCLDEECGPSPSALGGYPSRDRHVEFIGRPLWSPDGTRVAITAEDYTTKAQSVIVREPGGKTTEFTPPPEAGVGGAKLTLSWQDNSIYIRTSNGEWKLQSDTATWLRMK